MSGIKLRDDDFLDFYLQRVDYSPLSSAEEIELAKKIHKGCQRSRDKLVAANLRFVVTVAREYQNYDVSLIYLIGAGNMGLVKAAESFDATRGVKFISYAVWWINKAILQSLEFLSPLPNRTEK